MSEINEHSDEEAPNGISRRTVTKAMAWAVPAIAVSVSAPAYAASQQILTLDGRGCKLPGASASIFKGYVLGVIAANTFDDPITVHIDFIALNGEDLGGVVILDLSDCVPVGTGNEFTIPANTTFDNLVILTQNAASSSQGVLTGEYSITAGPGVGESVSAEVDVSPPLNGGSCRDFDAGEKQCIAGFAP